MNAENAAHAPAIVAARHADGRVGARRNREADSGQSDDGRREGIRIIEEVDAVHDRDDPKDREGEVDRVRAREGQRPGHRDEDARGDGLEQEAHDR